MIRHSRQYGGTKISIQDDTTKQWIPTTDREFISRKIMENLVLLRTIAPDTKCSMVLLGELNPDGVIRKRSQIYRDDETRTQFTLEERADRQENVEQGRRDTGVVMKISLVTEHSRIVKWSDVNKKTTTTRDKITREVETQHMVAMRMLCGQKASDIIPDIFSDCFLTVEEFNTQLTIQPQDELTRRIVEWIKTTATDIAKSGFCDIHIAFMDYVDGYDTFKSFYKKTHTLKDQLPTLYQAVAVILTLLLKGRIMSYDFHHCNLLTIGSKVMCLDLGRIYDFSKDETFGVLKNCMNSLVDSHGIRYLKTFNTFFNVDVGIADLNINFSKGFERLLKKPDDEVYGFSSLSLVDKRKFVYDTLIFLAFIDGITNKVKYGLFHDNNSIQFSHVLRRVFYFIDGDPFTDFNKFLSKFTIDYDKDCVKFNIPNTKLVENINTALDQISERLADMLGECPLQHYHPSHFDFLDPHAVSVPKPVSGPASAAESNDKDFIKIYPTSDAGFFANDPAGEGYYGGSKRLRRRNSNKKRKHKSRNKQTHRHRRRRRNSIRRRVTRHH
jgi:hypothetical protein